MSMIYTKNVHISAILFIFMCITVVPVSVFADHNVNINTASKTVLDTLPHVGPATADKIIAYRNEHGGFSAASEIEKIDGIGGPGSTTYEDIIGHLVVSSDDTGSDDIEGEDDVSAPQDDNGSSDDGENNDEPTEEDEEGDDNSDADNSSSGGGSQQYELKKEKLTVEAEASKTHAIAHTPLVFTGEAYYGNRPSATADTRWSFGDGMTERGRSADYIFSHPGTYVVTFSAQTYEQEAFQDIEIKIVEPDITLSFVNPGADGFIEISNDTDRQYELSGWTIYSDGRSFTIPPHTYVAASASVRFTARALGYDPSRSGTKLAYPDGTIADIYTQTFNKPPQAVRTHAPARTHTSGGASVSAVSRADGNESADTSGDSHASSSSSVATRTVAAVGASADSGLMPWLLMLAGLIAAGSIAVILLGYIRRRYVGERTRVSEEAEQYTISD